MRNAANNDKYSQRWNERRLIFHPDNCKQKTVYQLSDGYTVCIRSYTGNYSKIDSYTLTGNECRLLKRGQKIAEWKSIDSNADFYKIINHSNGNDYLIFRQDLYGYSVLNIAAGDLVQFFPEEPLAGGESFIWTDVSYSPITNVLAVSGCYWGFPANVNLVTFENPLSEKQHYIDLLKCLNDGYDRYEEVEFIQWVEDQIWIKCFDESGKGEEKIITKNEYAEYFRRKGKEL